MGFHMLAYSASLGAGAANTDVAAVADDNFTRRNSHYIFSERYKILAAFVNGVNASAGRLNVPTINAFARHHLWPVEIVATVPDWPGISDYRDYPIEIPTREELAIEGSNTDAGAQQFNALLWMGDDKWNRNLPRGQQRLTIRATGAVAGIAASWSTVGAITFAENLRGGYYTLAGAQCFDAGTLAVRFVFARNDPAGLKTMRPGILCTEAVGNSPLKENMGGFGALGAFDSDEPPQIQIFANATGASTQEMRLDLIYHGNSTPAGYY